VTNYAFTADMMHDLIEVEPLLSRDSYGVPVYGVAVTYRGRLTQKVRYVRTKEGSTVQSSQEWVGQPIPTMSVEDRVTLADGSRPIILNVTTHKNEYGTNDHTKVLFQ
jgi:hypothetical protein